MKEGGRRPGRYLEKSVDLGGVESGGNERKGFVLAVFRLLWRFGGDCFMPLVVNRGLVGQSNSKECSTGHFVVWRVCGWVDV